MLMNLFSTIPLLHLDPNAQPSPHHSNTTTPTTIPASFNIAILLPLCAMRPSRCADPLRLPAKEEKTSDCVSMRFSGQLILSYHQRWKASERYVHCYQ